MSDDKGSFSPLRSDARTMSLTQSEPLAPEHDADGNSASSWSGKDRVN